MQVQSVNWGRGVYSYIRVLPDEFLLNQSLELFSNEIHRGEREYMNIHPQLTL